MLEWPVLLPVLLTIWVACTVRATLGFGDALIAMPVLTLLVAPTVAAPLVALCSTLIAVVITWTDWHLVEFKHAARLVIASWFGIPVGAFFLTESPAWMVRGLLAIVLLSYAAFRWSRPRLPAALSPGWAYPFGFVAGVLGGAFNTAGVVVVVYGGVARWDARSFRANLQGFVLPSGIVLLTVHAARGLWTPGLLLLFVACLPVLGVSLLLGHWLARQVQRDPQRFERVLTIALFGLGCLLLAAVLGQFLPGQGS